MFGHSGRQKKYSLKRMLLVAGMVGFTWCGISSPSFAEKKYEGVHLKMLGIGDSSVTRLIGNVEEFERETGAKVTIDMFPYPGLIDKIVVETSSPRPTYQLLWIDSPWVGQLGESGALYDLTDFVKRDAEEIELDDIVPVQLQENSWQGQLLAFPASGMTWMMHYRKDLFEHPAEKEAFKAKYDYDLAVPETWTQFRDAAEFFTRRKGETLAGKVLEADFYGNAQAYSRVQGAITHDYFGMMRSFGGDFWDPETGLCAMNQDAHIKAAEFMKSLIPYNPEDYMALMWDLRTGYMERGEAALSLYWSVRSVRLENPKEAKVATTGDVGYAPNPTFEGKPFPAYTGALSFGINAQVSEREAEAAWEFIKWGTSKDIMTRLADQGISQFRKSILGDPELQQKYPYYKALLDQQENAKRRIFHPFYADVEEVFGLELNKFMLGEQTAQEALNKATENINSRLAMFPLELRQRWINDEKAQVLRN